MQKTPLSLAIASVMVVGATMSLNVAAASADAGVQLNQIEQQKQLPQSSDPVIQSPLVTSQLPAEKGPSFEAKQFKFSGNKQVDDEALAFLSSDALGQTDLQGLSKLALMITEFYRASGFTVARAYIPPQEIADGVIEIAIVEGQVGKVTASSAPLPEELTEGYLSSLKQGEVVTDRDLERTMLLLNDLPGMSAQARLKPGENKGETDIAVDLQQTAKYQGNLSLDNHGSERVGEHRLSANLQINNPFRLGDKLTLSLLGAEDGGTVYGGIDYNLPLGYQGWRAGVSYSNVNTDVGEELDALGIESEAEVLRLYASYPIIRSRKQNLTFQADYRYKSIESEYDSAFSILNSDEDLQVASLGLSYDQRDNWLGGGIATAALTLSGGLDGYDGSDKPSRLNADAEFTKTTLRLSRLQRLDNGFSAYLNIRGQHSDDLLPASEQISLGGAHGVRAYESAFALGDSGMVSNLELRYQPASVSAEFLRNATFYAFYDYGFTELNDTSTEYDLGAIGLGLTANMQNDFSVDLSYATKAGGDEPDADDNQFWLRVTKWFN